ncbi:MAG: hypothetical protein ACD_80C00144G0007 [uncultured bacterium (gcode 4)]|uniref:AmmeMemoRadiSam system protein B n=1 Tax=uncultured bacterium (gcode 4) TaxID=1234023 RepID=K1YHV6_9BACT|nr:MAG: hypothetical protein ACD_80C00144G0007 [uncultured bacterium (gcode 4)]
MTLSPEVVAEQVMGYVVWASELIPTLTPSPKKPYSLVILPQGPHFYTWLLQAAGYLLLDSQKKKILVISQQSDDSENILVDTSIFWPVFWQTRETPMTTLSKIARSIGAKLSTKKSDMLQENIRFQLPFLRVITDIKQMIHIGIGDEAPQIQLKKLLTWINKNIQEYNIIFLTNIELSKPTQSKKSDEERQISKLVQTYSLTAPLLTLFQKVLNVQKKKSEIIAYVNPGDFGKIWVSTTRYVCAVG